MSLPASKKQLVIDGQLWQTTAWDRGMGKYSLSLFEAYARLFGSSNVTVVFNSELEIKKDRQQYLNEIMPEANFTELKLPVMPGNVEKGRESARATWDSFIKESFGDQQIDFLILNLFTFDYCATFPTRANKMFIFYDLLPLAYWKDYSKYFSPSLYFAHFNEIFEADLIFSISNSAKGELIDLLAVDPEKIINISGAYIKRERAQHANNKFKDLGRYFLMPTSDYPNKNNLNAVRGFAKFNEIFGNTLSLVLTSNLSETTKKELSAYSENLIFSGNVSDEELETLFEDSELVLSTPITEGLGLPILEAVAATKPVVCSKIEVFKEVSNSAFYFCNQNDPDSICAALLAAFTKEDWANKQKHYKEILESLTWDNSARTLLAGTTKLPDRTDHKKSSVLIVMPSPDEYKNSVGQLIQGAHGYMKDYYKINYFTVAVNPVPTIHPLFLDHLTSIHDGKRIKPKEYSKAGVVIYGIDKSQAASHILMYAIARPGIILLDSADLKDHIHDLINDGYLDKDLAVKIFGEKFAQKEIEAVLEKLGNKIVKSLASVTGNNDDKKSNSARLFGKNLANIIKQERS